MEVSYKRDMNHTYLIMSGEENVDTSTYPVRMMLSNQWKAFLSCRIQGMDNQFFFYYDITSRQSLSGLYGAGKMNYRQLKELIEGVLDALEEAEEYLLETASILLEADYIFWDSQKEQYQFCYFPGEKTEGNLQRLTEYLLPRIDHRDQEAVVLGYGIYRKAMEENFQCNQLRELLYQSTEEKEWLPEKSGEISMVNPMEDKLSWWADDTEEEMRNGWDLPLVLGAISMISAAAAILCIVLGIYFGHSMIGFTFAGGFVTIFAGSKLLQWKKEKDQEIAVPPAVAYAEPIVESCEKKEQEQMELETVAHTTLLHQGEAHPSLIPVSGGNLEILKLQGEQMLIGKIPGTVDLIVDVPTVSRIHARILKKADGYYLQDMNSKNGTRVNGKELIGEESWLLKDKDLLTFADISYQYYEKR